MRRRPAAADEDIPESRPDGKEGSPGPSTLVQPLFESGRLKEAAAVLARLEDEGAPPWEVLLWRARIAEKERRWSDAQRGFAGALAARPGAVELELDFARYLESRGRLSAAEGRLRRALQTRERVGEVHLALSRLYRRRGREDSAREQLRLAARAVREGIASPSDQALLVRGLAAAGRLLQAERELLRASAPVDPGAWMQGLLTLVRAGRWSRSLERAFRASPPECARSWPRVFSALLCARLYAQAFGLAEAMLRRLGPPDSPWELLWPWYAEIPSAVGQDRFFKDELARLARASRKGGFPRWFAFCRAILLDQLARRQEAWAEHAAVSRPPQRLYAWMQQSFVLTLINRGRFREAVALGRLLLRRHPGHKWVRERLAQDLPSARRGGRPIRRRRGPC
ncbi:MAG: hypothetical protein HY926_16190 [Elusimicrobia bacterium]|nr:hypothetical protein [Elusimicrobiota bacterium]